MQTEDAKSTLLLKLWVHSAGLVSHLNKNLILRWNVIVKEENKEVHILKTLNVKCQAGILNENIDG